MKEDDELDELEDRSEDLPEEEEEVDQTVDEDAADPAQDKFDRLVPRARTSTSSRACTATGSSTTPPM